MSGGGGACYLSGSGACVALPPLTLDALAGPAFVAPLLGGGCGGGGTATTLPPLT